VDGDLVAEICLRGTPAGSGIYIYKHCTIRVRIECKRVDATTARNAVYCRRNRFSCRQLNTDTHAVFVRSELSSLFSSVCVQ